MSLTLPILIILAILVLLFSFINGESSRMMKGRITLKELRDLPCSHPPLLVTTIKGGRIQETVCYLTSDERNDEPKVVEVIPDREFISSYGWFERRLGH